MSETLSSPAEKFGCPTVSCDDPLWCIQRGLCKTREQGMHPLCDRPALYDRGECCGRYPCAVAARETPTPSRAERGEGI